MVIIALPADDLINQVGVLQPGDKVDILFSLTYGQGGPTDLVSLDALQNVAVQAIVVPPEARVAKEVASQVGLGDTQGVSPLSTGPSKAILVAVNPQDALLLKYLKDAGAILDYALRPPDDTSKPLLDPVTLQYLIDTYGLDIPLPTEAITLPVGGGTAGP